VFDEVMALRSNGELTEFAAGKLIAAQPITVEECGAAAERPARGAAPARRRRS
jgi:hypothetical protein